MKRKSHYRIMWDGWPFFWNGWGTILWNPTLPDIVIDKGLTFSEAYWQVKALNKRAANLEREEK